MSRMDRQRPRSNLTGVKVMAIGLLIVFPMMYAASVAPASRCMRYNARWSVIAALATSDVFHR
jgi:hypothetical protein